MKVLLVGLSHHTAPVDVRERFAGDAEDGGRMLRTLLTYTGNGVVVATCNRTEVYTTVRNTEVGVQHLRRFLSDYSHIPPEVLDGCLVTADHEEAARHLFRVTSGIDSMIVGEEQVLGQVREAMKASRALDGLNPTLYALLSQSLRVGKAARTHTAISRRAVSVSSAAVGLARERFGDLHNATVLVVSAGHAGALTARALADNGAGRMLVTSRNFDSAARLANALGGQPLPFSDLEWALGEADVVVSSTAAPTYVLDYNLVRRAMDRRPERSLLLVDIAVPRDVEPSAAGIPGVALLNIDDIQSVTEANLEGRRSEIAKVERLIEREVEQFVDWWNRRAVTPTVAALRNRAEDIRRNELERTLARMPHLTEADRQRLGAMTSAIMKKLLHEPLVRLKAGGADNGYVEAVRGLFALVLDEPAGEPPEEVADEAAAAAGVQV